MRSIARRFFASRSTELVRNATARRKFSDAAAPVTMITSVIASVTRYSTREKPERRCLIYVFVSTISGDQGAHAAGSFQIASLPLQFHGHQAEILAVDFANRRR